jgi:acyl-CoA synthetase (AMP-forming)/AMP-acid ligase II
MSGRAEHAAGTVPPMKDFGAIIRGSARAFGENVAVSCEDFSQTYAALHGRACRLANALAGLGLRAGDRVALLGPNERRSVEQVAGISLGGFVRAALYAHQTAEVNAYLLGLVDARALIVDAALAGPLREHLAGLEQLEHVIVYGGERERSEHDYDELLARAAGEDPLVRSRPEDLHVIRFSAGTTGMPKGIVHDVQRWLAIGNEYRWVTPQLDERDVYLALGPLTHAAVLFLWPILQVGGRVAVVPAFDPGAALELIERERATITLMVPTMIQALVAHPDARRRDLSSLRCLNYAAAPISETTIARAIEVFGDGVLYQLYGQSESVPVTMLLPHEHLERPRSVGRPTPNTVVSIVDEDGRALGAGEIGEIASRSPGNMLGLWKDPQGTAARTLPDGSILTRDIGYLDDRGYVFLADRKEDMIISGGHNIWPAALENAIAAHPAVREVCVVGVPHERWGETPKAVVVLAEGAEVGEAELIALTRERVGSVQKVTSVEVVDELPKSGVGKVLRRVVRERYWTEGDRLGRA